MKKNTLAVFAIVLVILVIFGGCASMMQNLENEDVREYAETMLDALIADDFQTAYALVSRVCTESDFLPIFRQMQHYLGDTDAYELKLLYISANNTITNGQTRSAVNAVYEMTGQCGRTVVTLMVDSQYALSTFSLTPYEQTDYYVVGTVQNMHGATGMQWGMLLLNLGTLGIVVFAVVDCCRHKIKKKALWILLILAGFASVGATVSSGGFRLNLNLGWILAYSALLRYGSGTIVFRLMLPIGAVGYFIARHSLLAEKLPVGQPGEQEQAVPESESDPCPCADQMPVDDPADPADIPNTDIS